ncbi:sn-1-specific diacylglycerol lipase ABHD11 [Parasteatoda tepidariorum]|uniref:sn-1-specific diacylglycerol lipase ABHD11 n=1 Tax=Parasteatoda tepidariorum TaxID=114398 RepID=UPI001C722FAB|nr:protein ABHD11 isoform X1 [Parasteatoda tepidariorum]
MEGIGVRLAYKIFLPDSLTEVHKFDHDEYTNKALSEHPPVIFLHGITNTKETWDDCGQTVANKTTTKVYTLDARNHGDSEWTEKMDYVVMADDVARFMDSIGIQTANIIGHSMGGKTAMYFALRHSDRVHAMIIEDMMFVDPKVCEEIGRHYLLLLTEVLDKIPLHVDLLEAKRIAARHLTATEQKVDRTKALTPLHEWDGRDLPLKLKPEGGYEWKTNLEAIHGFITRKEFTPSEVLEEIGKDPETIYDGPVLVIYGTHSILNVLSGKEEFVRWFPKTVYEPAEGATHTIHIEYPETFTELVCNFILKCRDI